ncbi:hypothetical protein TorRG33x02_343670, partial [Trema orientale]
MEKDTYNLNIFEPITSYHPYSAAASYSPLSSPTTTSTTNHSKLKFQICLIADCESLELCHEEIVKVLIREL